MEWKDLHQKETINVPDLTRVQKGYYILANHIIEAGPAILLLFTMTAAKSSDAKHMKKFKKIFGQPTRLAEFLESFIDESSMFDLLDIKFKSFEDEYNEYLKRNGKK